MKKVFFLVNSVDEFKSHEHLQKYLSDVKCIIQTSFPISPEKFDLIVLWNYRKIIPNISNLKNVIIFHGSDLPLGKGWAPIYNSIINKKSKYTISGILPGENVDGGDIIVKAKFSIKDFHTAESIREFDNEISILLIKKILEKFPNSLLKGQKQDGGESFFHRRYPKDNEIKFDSKISDIFDHLRACEIKHPAFFFHNEIKYIIQIKPEKKSEFPDDLEIKFFDK